VDSESRLAHPLGTDKAGRAPGGAHTRVVAPTPAR
jgi:hypothetical protein